MAEFTLCSSNQQCQSQLGDGACCLFFRDERGESWRCRAKAFVDYYTKSKHYDEPSRTWTDPDGSEQNVVVFCKQEPLKKVHKRYPYPQPYAEPSELVLQDIVNRNVFSDMFFKPKQVKDWDDQLAKWFQAWFWQFTPVPIAVLISNLVCYLIDGFTRTSEEEIGTFPTMYSNFFARSVLSFESGPIWGPFVWYDMFTWAGFFNWLLDALMVDFIFLLQLQWAFRREQLDNWRFYTIEEYNFVDMNRLGTPPDIIDPYDKRFWSSLPNGKDCNGRAGYGNYCYCPSQGYNCKCKPTEWA